MNYIDKWLYNQSEVSYSSCHPTIKDSVVAAATTTEAAGIEAVATIIIFMDVLCKREVSDM